VSGNGETKLAIVGGYLVTSGRRPLWSDPLMVSEWDRIMHIASIQARTWDYTGPYGYNDMDMLGIQTVLRDVDR